MTTTTATSFPVLSFAAVRERLIARDETALLDVREEDPFAQEHPEAVRLDPGQVEAVSPTVGDLHRVHNAHADRVSISIHVYGANIGAVRRHTYPAEGGRKPFVSGYSNTLLPNLWDRSAELRASTDA